MSRWTNLATADPQRSGYKTLFEASGTLVDMMTSPSIAGQPVDDKAIDPELVEIQLAIAKAAELLPAQGPITAFVFLNTLQALEDLPFEQGLLLGANLFGVQPYLTENRYREKMARDRIRIEDLSIVLRRDLAERA